MVREEPFVPDLFEALKRVAFSFKEFPILRLEPFSARHWSLRI
jgi:hypothetical protein